MKKSIVHQILSTWWCLLIVNVVTDIIDELFQHALSKLGVVVHQRTVLLRFYGGGGQFYSGQNTGLQGYGLQVTGCGGQISVTAELKTTQ